MSCTFRDVYLSIVIVKSEVNEMSVSYELYKVLSSISYVCDFVLLTKSYHSVISIKGFMFCTVFTQCVRICLCRLECDMQILKCDHNILVRGLVFCLLLR